MDNEATRIISDEPIQNEQATSATQAQPEADQTKKSRKGNTIAAAAGGFVVGAAAGAATTAAASNRDETDIPVDAQAATEDEQSQDANSQTETEAVQTQEANAQTEIAASQQQDVPNVQQTPEAPAPEQVILANDEGIRYAHVEADNFSDAFAQARQQVGPGGVFEYNGRLYGTYYADEWNNMTSQERADYQSRVNEVAPSHHTSVHKAAPTHVTSHHDVAVDAVPSNAEMISAEPVDSQIRVLGVEAVQNEDGQTINVALVECEGDQALFVDVDNNGVVEVLLHDDNQDGQIQDSEVHDISEAGIGIDDLVQAQIAQEGEVNYASADDMPDYVNDADSIMSI